MQTTDREAAAWASAQVYRSGAARSDNRPFVRLAATRQEPPADEPEDAPAGVRSPLSDVPRKPRNHEPMPWLTPERFWWGYVVAVLLALLLISLAARG